VTSKSKKPKSKDKVNKKTLIHRLLLVPKKSDKFFWAKELKILNNIISEFPDQAFWTKIENEIIKFEKVPSLAIHLFEQNKKIKERYKLHFYEVKPIINDFSIGEKIGNDYRKETRPKTIKQFLS
jgi:hypothetical protein